SQGGLVHLSCSSLLPQLLRWVRLQPRLRFIALSPKEGRVEVCLLAFPGSAGLGVNRQSRPVPGTGRLVTSDTAGIGEESEGGREGIEREREERRKKKRKGKERKRERERKKRDRQRKGGMEGRDRNRKKEKREGGREEKVNSPTVHGRQNSKNSEDHLYLVCQLHGHLATPTRSHDHQTTPTN
ncbi:Octapeptide-repeat protein T2, partial [Ophiophagus hannah]